MLELYLLRQLAAFAEYGTLSEAAEKLFLSQPALSRNMRKLEEDIGVPLFVRSRNKIELNENGRLTAELAEKALSDIDAITVRVREFDLSRRTISLGVCAPAPVWKLSPLLSQLYPEMSVRTEIAAEEHILHGLDTGLYQLGVLHFKPDDDKYTSGECCTEALMFSLPPTHRLAGRKQLYFSDLDGENMLLMSDIGFWHDMTVEKMPNSRFLIQNDRYTFGELVTASVLPSFSTDLAKEFMGLKTDRVDIPISDKEAKVMYYLVCKRENAGKYERLFKAV